MQSINLRYVLSKIRTVFFSHWWWKLLLIYWLLNPICPGAFLSNRAQWRGWHIVPYLHKSWQENAFDMTFSKVILCNVTNKIVERNFQNCSYMDVDVTNYVNFFEKLSKNWLKLFFSKINLVTVRKKYFQNFFTDLKVKITYKFNIYIGWYANVSKSFYKKVLK